MVPHRLTSVNAHLCYEGTTLISPWVPRFSLHAGFLLWTHLWRRDMTIGIEVNIPVLNTISKLRIVMAPTASLWIQSKVEAITKWPRPTTVTEGEKVCVDDERSGEVLGLKTEIGVCSDMLLPSVPVVLQIYSDAVEEKAWLFCDATGIPSIRFKSRLEFEKAMCTRMLRQENMSESSVLMMTGVVWFEDRLCVPNDQALREKVMTKLIVLHLLFIQPFRRLPMRNGIDFHDLYWFALLTQKRHDAIWVVETLDLHGTNQLLICPTRSEVYVSFLERIIQKLGELRLSHVQKSISNPQTDVPDQRGTIQNLEDMLRLVPLEWTAVAGMNICAMVAFDEGPKLNHRDSTNEKVAVAKEKLKEARSRQKSYADKHRRDLEFQTGDRVFLKVSPFRGVKRFGIKGKLSPRFIGRLRFWNVLGEIQADVLCPRNLNPFRSSRRVMKTKLFLLREDHLKNHPERELPGRNEES
ncbi:hypothetical protein Tco_0169496 [Tanacetum coccineum]